MARDEVCRNPLRESGAMAALSTCVRNADKGVKDHALGALTCLETSKLVPEAVRHSSRRTEIGNGLAFEDTALGVGVPVGPGDKVASIFLLLTLTPHCPADQGPLHWKACC